MALVPFPSSSPAHRDPDEEEPLDSADRDDELDGAGGKMSFLEHLDELRTRLIYSVYALVGGCVQRVFFPNVNAATIRVLAAEGVEVVVPPGQGCCGALSVHAGRTEEARRLARALVETFEREQADVVVVNAAGCGSHLKDHGVAAFDVTEALADAELPELHPLDLTVAYQDSCHLRHAQRLPAA